jgi:hypothetical protein
MYAHRMCASQALHIGLAVAFRPSFLRRCAPITVGAAYRIHRAFFTKIQCLRVFSPRAVRDFKTALPII